EPRFALLGLQGLPPAGATGEPSLLASQRRTRAPAPGGGAASRRPPAGLPRRAWPPRLRALLGTVGVVAAAARRSSIRKVLLFDALRLQRERCIHGARG